MDSSTRSIARYQTMELFQMKIAITGGTAGIGQALGNKYEALGHEVVRLSRRTGHNIRVIPKMADTIQPCDLFINNAQAGYAQSELLFAMADRWQGTKKHIIVMKEKAAFELYLLSGDVRKLGHNRAMSKRLSQESTPE